MLAAAAFGALFGCRLAALIPLALWGAISAGGVLVERWRYQLLAEPSVPLDATKLRAGAGVIVSHDERGNIAITPSPSLAGIITELGTSRLL